MKTLGICWGIGLFCVIIPIVHFFAVPALLIAGPFVAFWIFDQENRILDGVIACPKCGKDYAMEPGRFKWPIREICPNCHESATIERG